MAEVVACFEYVPVIRVSVLIKPRNLTKVHPIPETWLRCKTFYSLIWACFALKA